MMVKGAKALEMWCRRVTEGYPGVDVCNMTTSWKDGLAFCAILHRYRPERLDFHTLDKKDIRGNNALAYRVAEDTFGIPSLLDPDDMAKCVAPDRLSILTQVSEYYHRLKNLQPRGNPHTRSIPEPIPLPAKNSTTTATATATPVISTTSSTTQTMKLSRTSSTSSSGVASMASSCESSSSSVCDSPPPSTSPGTIKQKEQPLPEMDLKPEVSAVDEPKSTDLADEKVLESGLQNLVVLRKGKTSEAQRRALATRRRLVQSMIVESSSGMSSLCSPSPSPPSPAIEKENPFREAMMKFSAMEQDDGDKTSIKKKTKVFSTKSTETLVPTRDSKSTQTTPTFVAKSPTARMSEDGGAFRTCLRTQLSCPAATATPASTPTTSRPRAPSTGPLSYTSTPRPYTSQSMLALNRSLTNLAHQNSSNQQLVVQPRQDLHLQHQLQQQRVPTTAHRRPLSMLVTQNDTPLEYRNQRSGPTHPLPGTGFTPPMYQQNSPGHMASAGHMVSPLWSPNSSLYLTPMGHGSPSSSGYASSVYSTPIGASPCRNSNRYTGTPLGQSSSNNSSPVRYRPGSGYHHHMQQDRLQLHIEGQSSLV